METAYFAAGCFWSVEEIYWQQEGVIKTEVGYMEGSKLNPTYQEVCTGLTGHAETVKVIYDSAIISYQKLLEIFWEKHDPTQGLRQGNDIGSQYRSIIFTTTNEQLQLAESSKKHYQKRLTASDYGEITTEIIDVTSNPQLIFYPAEENHQKYLLKNPNGYRCFSATGIKY